MLGYILNVSVYFNVQVHIMALENLEVFMTVLMKISDLLCTKIGNQYV